jgi:hypothetical protein
MALRPSLTQLSRKVCQTHLQHSTASAVVPWQRHQQRQLATPSIHTSPSATQVATGSKGPTAIVFMNMGGPSTTDEVGDFLSRLFVCLFVTQSATATRLSRCKGRCRFNSVRPASVLPWASYFPPKNAKDPETICGNRGRFSHSQVE